MPDSQLADSQLRWAARQLPPMHGRLAGPWSGSPCMVLRTAQIGRGTMQVFVRSDRTHTLQLAPDATVRDVKEAIATREGLPVEDQRLLLSGVDLEDEDCLSKAGVLDEATLQVLGRLLGGAKKRKKKTYTKPKKIKHKHKKVKLRILKFYKVDDSGKVQRLRKTCPSEECGPGVFMATHFNRVYCGKCHLTYMMDQPAAGGKSKK